MSKEKTQKEKDGFGFGLFTMAVLHLGSKLLKEPGWITYLGFSMILFSVISVWNYAKPSKKLNQNKDE